MLELEIVLRLVASFALSLLFGLERQRSHKPTGFGTFVFVTLGASALAVTAITIAPGNSVPLLAAAVTSIGFLGAGALIKTSDKIFGFTTAASLWFFAAIGLIIGIGEYLLCATLYCLVWAVVVIDRLTDKLGLGFQEKITINTNMIVNIKDIEGELEKCAKKIKLISIEEDKKNEKLSVTHIIYGNKDSVGKVTLKVREEKWFESLKIGEQ